MKFEDRNPKSEIRDRIDWTKVKRVLVVRLRSIGDTVLATPSLAALRRFLPDAQIDILLEDWVAPVLEGFDAVDNVLTVSRKSKTSRLEAARQIRRNRYDVAFNLHGGTTATFFVRFSGARYRVGFAHYSYKFLYTHLLSSSADFWQKKFTHSAEQQLALLGFAGVPVDDRPKSRLTVTEKARDSIKEKLQSKIQNPKSEIALIHPAAATATKQWASEKFAEVIEYLAARGIFPVVAATPKEAKVIEEIKRKTSALFDAFTDLSLPEITALAARASVFVGNDSGIAHIAAAVETPSVVVFGSSNRNHWRPWTNAPHEVVYENFACQPCAGFFCKEFDAPRCILSIRTESVINAIEKVLKKES